MKLRLPFRLEISCDISYNTHHQIELFSNKSVGSRGDFSAIKGLHPQVEQLAQRAVALLSAPQAKGGEYTVVLDPVLAGVFVHEAFGHLSESDFVYENDRMR